jgi:FkbM family methyltransferase
MALAGPVTSFSFRGEEVQLRLPPEEDHLTREVLRRNTFYELDCLEAIEGELGGERGAALDVGACFGNHSIYFARVLGCDPVVAFEADPVNFALLEETVRRNDAGGIVRAKNLAAGAEKGFCRIERGGAGNVGTSAVSYGQGGVPVVPVDADEDVRALRRIVLLKIDVEGAEVPALRGAARILREHRPLLCVEAATGTELKAVLRELEPHGYFVVRRTGATPTYLMRPLKLSRLRRAVAGLFWLLDNACARRGWRLLAWAARRCAALVAS